MWKEHIMKQESTPVIIIGGSLVGLSAAVFLSFRGVKNIVIEKHTGSATHPRAIGYTEHTLEFYRAVGLGEKIRQAPPGVRLRRARVESLAGRMIEETLWTPGQADDQRGRFSPCTGAAIAQDSLEPLLRERAVELGTDLRLGVEFVSFEQDEDGVTAVVRERDSGAEYPIRAQYMIAADGAKSAIRESLGIERKGRGYIRTVRSVLFRAPEADAYLEKGIQQFEIEQPNFSAFLTTYNDGRWVLMFSDDTDRSEPMLKELIAKALGKEMGFEILTTGRWEMSGLIAESYSSGRVFIAGDAAHTLPPTRGGFGANTGIDDVYNLSWKLEYVLSGRSSAELLDTYTAERQPIGWLRHQQTFSRPDYEKFAGGTLKHETIYGDVAMELGQLLRSTAVIGGGDDLPPARHPVEWAGQPGVRAPHAWVIRDGERISTIDLFIRKFVLLSADKRWKEACVATERAVAIPLEMILVGEDIRFQDDESFQKAFGVGPTGASLVRPDGVVAWRAAEMPQNPTRTLLASLAQIASSVARAEGLS